MSAAAPAKKIYPPSNGTTIAMALDHDHVAAGEILCAEKTLELAPLGDDGAQSQLELPHAPPFPVIFAALVRVLAHPLATFEFSPDSSAFAFSVVCATHSSP